MYVCTCSTKCVFAWSQECFLACGKSAAAAGTGSAPSPVGEVSKSVGFVLVANFSVIPESLVTTPASLQSTRTRVVYQCNITKYNLQ